MEQTRMTPERWQQVKRVYTLVRGEAPERRGAALQALCGDDAELYAEVESLLRHGDQAESFLEEAALRVVTDGGGDGDTPAVIGRRIGAYTVIREIAAGGMGVVYEARQEHPSRVVALKVMKAGLSSPSARRRFEDESQTLARLQHPGIAQVYEAGTHAEGGSDLPYFAMELVPDATTITEFATAQRLDLRRRLELFIDVCEAVHYGHQKGIIHRDLKPANILVSATGQPKIIDFGIARMLDPAAAVATQTATGQLVGTLQYMSPEQIDGDPHAVDVRCDVYALGVVLFELLCEQLPYDVTKSGIYEAARTIKERPPLRPSTLSRALRGDLDTIVLRCLEKKPSRRYQSVADLAGDLRRHLRHEPIEARRDSTFYVLRRHLYRHRWAAAVFFIALGAIVTSAWAISSRAQREEARMRAVLSLARTWTRDNAPVAAAPALWKEFLTRDCDRTRFALWEFYLKYPRVYANADLGPLVDVEYSPSGRWLAVVTNDGHVHVLAVEPDTGKVLYEGELEGVEQATCLKFSTAEATRLCAGDTTGFVHEVAFDGKGCASGGLRTVDLWDEQVANRSAVGALALSPCGRWLAAGGDASKTDTGAPAPADARIRLWRLDEIKLTHEWNEPGWALTGLGFSGDGLMLAATFARHEEGYAQGGRSLVWSTATGEVTGTPKLSTTTQRGVLFSEDASRLFTGEGGLLEWDIQGDAEYRHPMGRTWGIRSLAAGVGPVAWCVAIGCGDGSLRFYDASAGQFLARRGYHDIDVADDVDVAVSPDGHFVASVALDGLSVWQLRAEDDIRLAWPLGTGDDVALAVDGLVATHTVEPSDALPPDQRSSVIELWSSGSPIRRTPWDADCAMALCADGSRLALSKRGAQELLAGEPGFGIWILSSPDWTDRRLAAKTTQAVTAMEWLGPEGRHLLVALGDGRAAICSVDRTLADAAASLTRIHQFNTACTRFAVDSRGEWLAACSEGGKEAEPNGHVCLWRVADIVRLAEGAGATGDAGIQPVSEFAVHRHVWSLTFVCGSSGRLLIATSGRPREVHLWDPRSGNRCATLVGHGDAVRRCIALGPRQLVTASDDLTARLWDVPTGEELCVLGRSEETIPRIAVAGGKIAIACDRAVRVLDPDDVDRFITYNRAYEEVRLSRVDQAVVSGPPP